MAREGLPTFMVIGAVKAATTWLAGQLRNHPLLWLPLAEPHFFSSEFHRGFDWYRALLSKAPPHRIVGEKSADYLGHPDAAERIAAVLPDVKMIAQLRDPVQRAYSDYCMLYRRGTVTGDPRRYLDGRGTRGNRFLEGGKYARHIERLRRHIPDARLKVVLYEDIVRDPRAVVESVCEHIGVPPHLTESAAVERNNDSRAPTLPLPMRRLLRPARPLIDPLRSSPWFARAHGMLARPVRYPPLTDELRAMLREYYRDDILQLGHILERDLTCWLAENDDGRGAGHALAYQGGRR